MSNDQNKENTEEQSGSSLENAATTLGPENLDSQAGSDVVVSPEAPVEESGQDLQTDPVLGQEEPAGRDPAQDAPNENTQAIELSEGQDDAAPKEIAVDLAEEGADRSHSRIVTRPPERKPIEGSRISYKDRNKLKTKNRDPNFVYRVVNTDDQRYAGRVESLMERGYIVCEGDEVLGDADGTLPSQVGNVVGRPVGHGTRGVLMKIPRKFYEEDQRQKQAEVDKTEEGMIDEELLNKDDTYGAGLKVDRGKPKVQVQQN